MTIALREYQNDCIETVVNEYSTGVNRQLISLPTGSGKTVIMGSLAKQLNKRTLFLAHREELIDQARDKFALVWPEADIGICMGESNEINHQIVIGSVQSCSRPKRIELLKEQGFDVLMIDEAHHASAQSYKAIIDALCFVSDPQKLLLGVTATPHRADKNGLGDVFQKITFSRSIGTMIKAGYLAPIIGRKILTNFSLKGISLSNDDFNVGALAEVVNTEERNKFVVEKFIEYASDRKTIAFCCDVQHCHDLANAFKSHGIASGTVWGDMSSNERKNALDAFKHGRIQVLTSCGVLTEGFDEPSISAVIMARPTRSQSLYIQCIGRGIRKFPGKEDCLCLDFSDKYHNLDAVATLSNTIPEAEVRGEKVIQLEVKKDKRSKIEIFEECDREFDVVGGTHFIWIPVENEWSLLDDEKNEIVLYPQEEGFIATFYSNSRSPHQIINSPLPLAYAQGVAEDYARRNLKVGFADAKSSWITNPFPPTKAQVEYLQKEGAFKKQMTKGECALEIRRLIARKNKEYRDGIEEPLSLKQRFFLESRGIDVSNMTKKQGIALIGKLKEEQILQNKNYR